MTQIPETITLCETPNIESLKKQVKNQIIYNEDRIRLFKYLKTAEKRDDKAVMVEYKRKTYNGEYYGRYFPTRGWELSATYSWRKIRASLFADHCNDIDIVNCHSVLLEQFYKKYTGIDSIILAKYIDNRDKIIADFAIRQAAIDRHNAKNNDCSTKRDLVKSLFTMVLYGGSLQTFEKEYGLLPEEYVVPDFFPLFAHEIGKITDEIMKIEDPYVKKLLADFRTEKGVEARDNAALSLILQDLEAKIVYCAMAEFANLSKSSIVAYMYDGFMVSKDSNIDSVCARLSNIVKAKTGYKVCFISKPFEEPLADPIWDIPQIMDPKSTLTLENYANLNIKEIENMILASMAFITNIGNSTWVFKGFKDGEIYYQILSHKSIRSKLEPHRKLIHVEIPEKKNGKLTGNKIIEEKKITLFSQLMELKEMITYDYIDFVPFLRRENAPRNIFNLFAGYKHQFDPNFIIKEALIQPFLSHVFNVWCRKDNRTYDYILNWFAHIIQKPTVKMSVAVVLYSEKQGAGKNVPLSFVCDKVIGTKYTTTITVNDTIFGRFNSILENKLLTVMDEVTDCGAIHQKHDPLKSIISRPKMAIEKKGIDAYDTKDFNNYIFLSNNAQPVHVEISDRRFLALELSNEYANKLEYFNPLTASFTEEAGQHLFHFLALRDINNFSPQIIPETKFKTELKANSIPLPLMFLFEILDGEIVDEQLFDETREYIRVPVDVIYAKFAEWMVKCGIHFKVNRNKFIEEIKKIMVSERYYVGTTQKRGYNIRITDAKNKRNEYLGQAPTQV